MDKLARLALTGFSWVRPLTVNTSIRLDGQGELYKRFQQMEQTMFGTVALPYYAVLEPDGSPVVAFGGLTRSPEEYVAFLREGLQ